MYYLRENGGSHAMNASGSLLFKKKSTSFCFCRRSQKSFSITQALGLSKKHWDFSQTLNKI